MIRQPRAGGSRLAHLKPGDFVLVWDGVKGRDIWQRIAEIEESSARLKLRVEGTDFFFDEALVVNFLSAEPTSQPFAGDLCAIEYTNEFPLAGHALAAVRTPRGLVLAFVHRLPHGRAVFT